MSMISAATVEAVRVAIPRVCLSAMTAALSWVMVSSIAVIAASCPFNMLIRRVLAWINSARDGEHGGKYVLRAWSLWTIRRRNGELSPPIASSSAASEAPLFARPILQGTAAAAQATPAAAPGTPATYAGQVKLLLRQAIDNTRWHCRSSAST
jgi:hypothetical protein